MNVDQHGFKIAEVYREGTNVGPVDDPLVDDDPLVGNNQWDRDPQHIYIDPDKIHDIDFSEVVCPYCKRTFYSKYNRDQHIRKACRLKVAHDYIDEHNNKPVNIQFAKEMNLVPGHRVRPCVRTDPREIIFVVGPQGCGKSTFCSGYINQYQELFPDNDVYIFSRLDADKAFEDLDAHRIQMDESLIDEPIDPKKELLKTLTVFDDYVFPQDKKLTDSIEALITDIILHGRDQESQGNDIYCLITGHQIRNYRKTRDILNECTSIVIYPGSNIPYQIIKFLKDYMQLKQKRIKQILSLPSRWVQIYTSYPQYVLHERGGFILREATA